MRFFIDGYNLMYALGLVRPRSQRSLAKCRDDLCEWIRRVHGREAEKVTVVFDGPLLGRQQPLDDSAEGPHVVFSRGETADDWLERFIQNQSPPVRLTLVSNDRRFRRLVHGRACVVWSCDDYLEWAMTPRSVESASEPAPEKPVLPTDSESWQREFGDIDNDPNLRRFNQVYRDFGLS